MLVQETISGCIKESREIRVAGTADEFYTKCGLCGVIFGTISQRNPQMLGGGIDKIDA